MCVGIISAINEIRHFHTKTRDSHFSGWRQWVCAGLYGNVRRALYLIRQLVAVGMANEVAVALVWSKKNKDLQRGVRALFEGFEKVAMRNNELNPRTYIGII